MAKDGNAEVSSVSLSDALAGVPDPRAAAGRRHPLPAVLAPCAVAVLSGARSPYAIAQFGRDRGGASAEALGFTPDRPTPCCSTLHYPFERLDGPAFEAAARRWARGRAAAAAGWAAVAIDGKALRGIQGHAVPGVHVLAAYAHEAKVVLDQVPVGAKTNEHEAALELLDVLPVRGKVVTGDAAFGRRDRSAKVVGKGAITSGR